MAKTLDSSTSELLRALIVGESVYLVLNGHTGGGISRPLYAINLRDCIRHPVTLGQVEFDVPALDIQGAVTFTGARFAGKNASGKFVDLGPVQGISFPIDITNANLNITGLNMKFT